MLNLYYSSDNKLHKKVYAYLTNSSKKLLATDVTKTKVTGTIWVDIAKHLELNLEDFIDKSNSDIAKADKELANFNTEDWLKILEKSPNTLKYPIIIHDTSYYLIKDAQQALTFLEGQSAGLDEQNPN